MNIRFGDFYGTLGRGLLFSLLKTFEREGLEKVVDTTVDGAKIQIQRGPFSCIGISRFKIIASDQFPGQDWNPWFRRRRAAGKDTAGFAFG